MAGNSTMEFDHRIFTRIMKELEVMEFAEEKAFANILLRFTEEYSDFIDDLAIELRKADPNAGQKTWWLFKELITKITLQDGDGGLPCDIKEPGGAK